MQDIEQLKKKLNLENRDVPNLKIALTHRSYAVECGLKYDNQRLEFLGDAVLEIILTEFLYFRYKDHDEGSLTQIRSALVREAALAKLAKEINLGDFLLIGKGEQVHGGASRDSTLSDLFEAVLGAMYLDLGLSETRDFLIPLIEKLYPTPHKLISSSNPKGQLQEYVQKRFGATPKYTILNVSGPEHLPVYEVEVNVNNFITTGCASNRKLAESDAAEKLMAFFLNDKDVNKE